MIEEPYRWVEAIANRREYIETQLASGNPIAAVGFRDGILFLTVGRTGQKIFEVYNRIAMGAIGHPGDIERLRMAAIEVASTEGFTRSAMDVSLRRMAHYSLSPALKAAFEQIYGPPYLARLLFAEVGEKPEEDFFLRLEYDGAIATNGATLSQRQQTFGALSATRQSADLMESFLGSANMSESNFENALKTALDAWTIGHMALGPDGIKEIPDKAAIAKHRDEQLGLAGAEGAVLERASKGPIRYRTLSDDEIRSSIRS